jgi:hypothetical protein
MAAKHLPACRRVGLCERIRLTGQELAERARLFRLLGILGKLS